MGQPVNQRAADGGKPGFLQFGGNNSDKGDRRPADDVAEEDGGNTGNDAQRWFFLKCGEIRLLVHGLADEFFFGKAPDKLSDHPVINCCEKKCC